MGVDPWMLTLNGAARSMGLASACLPSTDVTEESNRRATVPRGIPISRGSILCQHVIPIFPKIEVRTNEMPYHLSRV